MYLYFDATESAAVYNTTVIEVVFGLELHLPENFEKNTVHSGSNYCQRVLRMVADQNIEWTASYVRVDGIDLMSRPTSF